MKTLYVPRLPADPFARSAVSPQRISLAAQFSRSAVSVIPSKPGRAPIYSLEADAAFWALQAGNDCHGIVSHMQINGFVARVVFWASAG